MNKLISVLAMLFLMVGIASAQAPAGTISMTGSNIVDSTGTKLASGTVYFAPVDTKGNPISFHLSSGQVMSRPVSTTVTNGAFSTYLADTSLTVPANVCFSVSIIDNATGENVLGGGYTCVQPSHVATWCTSTVCNLDNYVPNLAPLGIVYPTTMAVGSVTNTFPGGAATITNVGTPSSAMLNFVLPQGIQGPVGAPTSGVNLTPSTTQNVVAPHGVDTGFTSLNGVFNASLVSGADIGAKINAVITSCAGAVCPIYIPAGTYSFTTPIVLASNVEIYGAGEYLTTLNYSGAANSTAVTSSMSTTAIRLHDFELQGPVETPSNLSSYNSVSGITILGTHTTLDKLYIAHFWLGGCVGLVGSNNTVSNSDLEYGKYVLTIKGMYNTAKNNYISNHFSLANAYEPIGSGPVNHWDGIISEPASYASIEGNTVEDNGQSGIYEGGNADISIGNRIIGNTVRHNWNRGIDNGVTGDEGTNGIFSLSVVGNHVIDNLADNIWLNCVQQGVVSGNYTEYTASYPTFFGVSATSSRSGIVVADICGTATADTSNFITVTGNTALDYQTISVSGLNFNVKATSQGNTFVGNATNASFFIATTVNQSLNTVILQNQIPPIVTNPVELINPSAITFAYGFDTSHTMSNIVDASGNAFFSDTTGDYRWQCAGGTTTCLEISPTAIISAVQMRVPSLATTQTPVASTTASDHSVPMVFNGTTYYVRLSLTP